VPKRVSIGGYYGGKQSMLADLLPHFAVRHDIFVELFAGSASVLLNKPRARIEVLNDRAGEVTTFWRALRDQPDELMRRIDATPPGEAAFREIIDAPATDDEVEIARRFFCRTQMAYGYIPTNRTNTLAASVGYAASRRRLPAVRDRIKDTVIEQTCATRLIARTLTLADSYPNPPLFYADPPYVPDTRPAGTGMYIHDPDGDDALQMHVDLLAAVARAAAAGALFVISGYASALYDDALTPARGWRRFEMTKSVNSPKRGGGTRVEIIWRNFSTARTAPAPDPLWQIVRNRR